MALYHVLDPFWSRFPWPDRLAFKEKAIGPVRRFRLSRQFFGRKMMATHCYLVGDTLIDCGFPAAEKRLLEIAADRGVRRLVLTHHHEDHAGNAAALGQAGLEVVAGDLTARLLAHDMPLPFYQHLTWGRTRPVRFEPDESPVLPIGDYEAEVVAAPGHALDQRALFVRQEGWLFSGDAFIHERVKVFRRDEDFAATLATLERLVQLDFDTLFCGHWPIVSDGRASLRKKLAWLLEIQEKVRNLDSQGLDVAEIVERLRLERSAGFRYLSMGDASAHNMVRSILHGPTLRPEVEAALVDS